MKKQYILKTIVVISLVIFALFLAGCTTGDDYIYSDISVSEDGKTITIKAPDESAVDTFLYYGEVPNAHLYGEKFRYENNLFMPDGSFTNVYSPLNEKDILYVEGDEVVYCYVLQGALTASEDVCDFLDGNYSHISFANLDKWREGVLVQSEREAFETAESANIVTNIDVRTLKDNLFYDIIAYDASGVLSVKVGAVFKLGNDFYYVDYESLPNSAFDADGNLSYRRGEIDMERLDGNKLTLLNNIMGRQKRIENTYTHEEGLYVGEDEEDTIEDALPVVICVVVLVGILLPLIPGAIYLFWILSAKRRNAVLRVEKKPLLTLPLLFGLIGCALWLVGGVAVFCLLLTI